MRAAKAEKERLDGELKEISRVKATLLTENAEVKKEKEKVDAENEDLRRQLKEASLKQDDKVDT